MTPQQKLFQSIDARIEATPDLGDRAAFLNMQLDAWEGRRERLIDWAKSSHDKPNPLSPPLSIFDVDTIIAEFHQRLAAVRRCIQVRAASIALCD